MFISADPTLPSPAAVGLTRLHLFCRFDFRQKIWALQALEFRRDGDPIYRADSTALASAVSQINSKDNGSAMPHTQFSDPSLGGDTHPEDGQSPD